jgi:hypothetical protein
MSIRKSAMGVAFCATMVATGAHADGLGVSAPAAPPVIPAAASPVPSLAFPAIYGAASAIPAPGGTAFIGLTYINPRDGISGRGGDGDLSFGYTFGSPVDNVSVTLAATILGLDPFADSGESYIGLSRMLRAGGNSATFIGASSNGWGTWGDAAGKPVSNAVYVSHLVAFPMAGGSELPVQFTLGYGDNSTLSDTGNGNVDGGVFYGVGVGVTQNLSLSLSGTETQVNMGLGLNVPSVPGLGISAGVLDVTDNTNRQQFSLTAAFAF